MKKILVFSLAILFLSGSAKGWFEFNSARNPRIAYVNNWSVNLTNDFGDTNPGTVDTYGGNANNAFVCGYPITFLVYIPTNNAGDIYGNYDLAELQYFQGTNTLTSTNWTTFARITNFAVAASGVVGAHLGMVNFYPPNTNNTFYLIRLYLTSTNTVSQAIGRNFDPAETNVTKNGGTTIEDEVVVLIKATPNRRPGLGR